MGVFRVSRGKAEYLYVKNKSVKKYIRITDSDGVLLIGYEQLIVEANKLDAVSKPGTGTKYLYIVSSRNKTYDYEQLVFRVQPPGDKSKSFNIQKLGYTDAFLKAKAYLMKLGYPCTTVPDPKNYQSLITKVVGELGYRSIIKEFNHVNPSTKTPPDTGLPRRRRLIR